MKDLLRLRRLLKPYFWQVLLSLLVLLGVTAARLVVPAIIGKVIDYGIGGGEDRYLAVAAFIILGVGLGRALLSFAQSYLGAWIAQHVSFDLRNQLYDHIQRLSFSFHDHSQTGQIISRCIEDVNSIRQFTGSGIVELFQIVLLLVGAAILLFLNNPRLAALPSCPSSPCCGSPCGLASILAKCSTP
jgi:ATP-binding cassette subfamily B protein